MNWLKSLLRDREKMREMIMYLVFGVLTTVISWATYFIWRQLLHLSAYPVNSLSYRLIANSGQVISFILAVAFAFVTNKRYVFQSKRTAQTGLWKELGLFVSARILAWILFDLVLFNILLALQSSASSADLWIKLLMNVLVVIFNYVVSKLVVFSKK